MKITIIGTGAFGTAIGNELVKNSDNDVLLFGINETEINDINFNHLNTKYFKDTKLNSNLKATSNVIKAFNEVDIICICIPSDVIRNVLENVVKPTLKKCAYFVNLSKGIDLDNLILFPKLIENLIESKYINGILKLSGPSFAKEVINQQPTILTLSCSDLTKANLLAKVFSTNVIKIKTSNEIEALEILSAIKNAYAIFLGIIDGLNYLINAKAFVFCSAIDEILIILKFFGIKNATNAFLTPSGIGDLFLTSISNSSRNYSFGYEIAKNIKNIEKMQFETIEGVKIINGLNSIMEKHKIDLPMIKIMYNVIYKQKNLNFLIEDFFEKGVII